MKRMLSILALCVLTVSALTAESPETNAPAPPDHSSIVYRTVGDLRLKAHVFHPPGGKSDDPRSAIVIFHGGGWDTGIPEWTFPMCRHFAARGMVAIGAQYRLSDRQGTVTPLEAMSDSRFVIRWLRTNARQLGIDPDRIAAAGSSAGGHLAASAAIFDDPPQPGRRTAAPDALLLWYPAVAVTADTWFEKLLGGRARPVEASPAEHVRPGLPPTIIFQGSADTVTPLAGVRRFCDAMKSAGNRCDLHVYDELGHLFGREHPEAREDAVQKADRFLVSEGFLAGEPAREVLPEGEPDQQPLRDDGHGGNP